MQLINSSEAPSTDGVPLSQAIETEDFIFLSGQVPFDPDTNEVVEGGIEAETRRVMDNLGLVLEEAGLEMNDVVKSSVFLTDLDRDFEQFNVVYEEYFDEPYPARSAIGVDDLAVDAVVEVDVIAEK